VTPAAAAVPTADATCLLFPGQCAADAVTDVATDAAGSVASSAVDAAAQSFMEAFWSFYIDWIITPWTKASSPVLAQTCGERNGSLSAATADCNDGALSGPVWELRAHLMWLTLFVMTLMILVAAGKMIWHRDGRPALDLLRAVVTTVFVSVAGVMLIDTLLTFGDEYSAWIIGQAADEEFIQSLSESPVATAASMTGLFLIVGLLGVLFSIVQVVLLMIRSGVIVLFAAALPLAAATSGSAWGKSWFEKLTGWTLAFVLYKPVAATVYATAIWMMQNSGDATSVIAGVALTLVAILALPALIKLLVPATSALAGNGGGGGMASAGMMMAAGARRGGGSGAASGAQAGAQAGAKAGPKGAAVGAVAGAAQGVAAKGGGS
jgi:hypothetical protein